MERNPKRLVLRSAALVLSLGLIASACGSSDSADSGTTAEGSDTTTASGEAAPEVDVSDVKATILAEQLNEVTEAEAIRSELLSSWGGESDYVAVEENVLIERVLAENEAGKGSADMVVALHGAFPTLAEADALVDLSDLEPELLEAGVPASYIELGRLGGDKLLYVPAIQANFMMVAKKDAVDYLPEGAEIDSLTWQQLGEWGANINEETGSKRIGFGAAEQGLIHRMIQGSLYPSYTGGMVTTFNSPEAVTMWEDFSTVWNDGVNPAATNYQQLQEQLLSGDVWIAFDHQARLIDALEAAPDEYVAFPAPSGPEGAGYMPVVGGLGISAASENPDAMKEMIRLWMSDQGQQTISTATGFFGTTAAAAEADLSPAGKIQAETGALVANQPNGVTALLPVGLGDRSGEFSKIYRDTFTEIVIGGKDPQEVLDAQTPILQELLDDTGAPCWSPDPVSDGPCQIS